MIPGILIVGNFLSHSEGTRSVCEDLAVRLAAHGRFRVLTASDKPGRLARLFDMLATVWRRRRDYEVAQVDVYSGPAFILAECVCAALRLVCKPYVLTLHGGNLPRFAKRWPQRMRGLLAGARLVTTPSRYLQEQMHPYREDLRLVPNGLDLSAYVFRQRSALQPKLVWLRAFHQIYNPSLGPKVVARLRREFPDITLTMIGPDRRDGSLPALRATARSAEVFDRIDLPGPVSKTEVPLWLDRNDIFLNTTNVDNSPVSVMEALACGLCVVSTLVGGIPYLLSDGQDSLLTPANDEKGMAEAVRRLLKDSALAARVSLHGRGLVESMDWSVVLPQWIDIFQSLLPSGSKRVF